MSDDLNPMQPTSPAPASAAPAAPTPAPVEETAQPASPNLVNEAETKLNEVSAGVEKLQSVESTVGGIFNAGKGLLGL